jgi:hypothetical protein
VTRHFSIGAIIALLSLSACGGASDSPTGGTATGTSASSGLVTIPTETMNAAPVPAVATPATVVPSAAPATPTESGTVVPDGWVAAKSLSLNFRQQNVGAAWSYAFANGQHRYEVREGDLFAVADIFQRDEVYDSINKLDIGKKYQLAFKFMLEPGQANSASWLLITQMQSTFDAGEAGHSPPFALELYGEKLRVVTRVSSAAISTEADTVYTRHYESPALARGQWYDVKVQIVFGPFSNGRLKVWIDNAQKVDFAGALGFNDVAGAYVKQGIYRSAAKETMAVSIRDLDLGLVE